MIGEDASRVTDISVSMMRVASSKLALKAIYRPFTLDGRGTFNKVMSPLFDTNSEINNSRLSRHCNKKRKDCRL